MKTIKAKVIMLPTEDKSANLMVCIKSHDGNVTSGEESVTKGELVYGFGKFSDNNYYEKQHLYATTSEEIKEGDWYYNLNTRTILVCNNSNINAVNLFNCRKIVATTDKSLMYTSNNGRVGYHLPQIPQSFIKQYAEAGGKMRLKW